MNDKFEKRVKRLYIMLSCFMLVAVMTVCPAFAADDPLAVVTNLSDFIFSLIRAIGLILLGFGILQIGLSLKSHDPSQRANGMLTVAGGIVITFTKEILTRFHCPSWPYRPCRQAGSGAWRCAGW